MGVWHQEREGSQKVGTETRSAASPITKTTPNYLSKNMNLIPLPRQSESWSNLCLCGCQQYALN